MKLRSAEKWWLGVCGAAIYCSGALLWWSAGWLRVAGPFGEAHHPLEAATRVAHTACGLWMLVAFGYLMKGHILPGWRVGRRLISGVTMCGLLLLLTLSGLGLLYGGEAWLSGTAQLGHTFLGIGAVAPLLWHSQGRKKRAPRAHLA